MKCAIVLKDGYYRAIDTAGRIVADSLRAASDSYPGYSVFDEGMFPYVRNYQLGFKDVHNQVVVPPIYNAGPADVSPADGGFAGIRFRDAPNKMDARPIFSSDPADAAPASVEEGDCVGTQFRDGVAIVVSADEKFGLINRRGELVAACIYDYIGPPEGGVYGARRGDSLFLLNRKGENILPFPYLTDPKFFPYPRVRDGLLCVMVLDMGSYWPNNRPGGMDDSASQVLNVKRSHKYKVGFVDTTGRLVIDTTLRTGDNDLGRPGTLGNKNRDFEDGLRDGMYCGTGGTMARQMHWNRNSQNPPPDPYYMRSDYYRFSGGRCLVWVNGPKVINTRGETLFGMNDYIVKNSNGFFISKSRPRYRAWQSRVEDNDAAISTSSLVDPSGKPILQVYYNIDYAGNGVFTASTIKRPNDTLLYCADTTGRGGFRKDHIGPGNVDRMDKAARSRRLKGYRILGESEGLVLVCKPGKHQQPDRYGMVDSAGHWVIPPDYVELGLAKNGLVPFAAMVATGPGSYSKKLWGYMDTSGRMMLKPQYEDATGFLEVPAK